MPCPPEGVLGSRLRRDQCEPNCFHVGDKRVRGSCYDPTMPGLAGQRGVGTARSATAAPHQAASAAFTSQLNKGWRKLKPGTYP